MRKKTKMLAAWTLLVSLLATASFSMMFADTIEEVEAPLSPGKTIVALSGSYRSDISALNSARRSKGSKEVTYSPMYEYIARDVAANFALGGKSYSGYCKDPSTGTSLSFVRYTRKFRDSIKSGSIRYAYSCTELADGKSPSAGFGRYDAGRSPGIYGDYPYGACTIFTPKGSGTSFMVTVLGTVYGPEDIELQDNISQLVTVRDSMISKITLSGKKKVKVGKSISIKASAVIKGAHGSYKVPIYRSAGWKVSKKRAAVSDRGTVTGISAGKTKVILKLNGKKYSKEITVR